MKTKVFKTKEIVEKETNISPIHDIIFNDLTLNEKMKNLLNSLDKIKLTPNGENQILSYLIKDKENSIYFPRKGDNSERFDAIIDFPSYQIVAEVEIPSTAILDAPRNLLDDYAVIKSRHKTDSLLIPLVICWDLPNKRTDYWNVVSDINEILNLKIKTINILTLAVYFWTDTPLNLENNDFYLDINNSEITTINNILKLHQVNPNDFPGYFSPFK